MWLRVLIVVELMLSIYRSVLVVYSVEVMFNLVNDVVFYLEFLLGCIDSKIFDMLV